MPDRKVLIDRDAADAVKRIERQMQLDGKLDGALASEGAALLGLPLTLGAIFVLDRILKLIDVEAVMAICFGLPILFGPCLFVWYLLKQR
jgi:hypothetical protein